MHSGNIRGVKSYKYGCLNMDMERKREQCISHKVHFEFWQCGTHMIKDGKKKCLRRVQEKEQEGTVYKLWKQYY